MGRRRRPDKIPPSRLPLEVYRRFKEATAATGSPAATWVREHLDQDDSRARRLPKGWPGKETAWGAT